MYAALATDDRAAAGRHAFGSLREHGRSFHLASLLLDRQTAQRCARLYAFCRHADDIADAGGSAAAAQARLETFAECLDGRPGQRSAGDPVADDFLALAEECRVPLGPARDLLDGLRSDLAAVRVRDVAELHRYCYRVAGTVGLMMCAVLGVRDRRAHPFAVDLGIAMQLTNIARDVCEDGCAGRRYLPATIVGDVSPRHLAQPDASLRPRLAAAVAWLLDEADRYYRSGETGLSLLPRRARLAMLVAARCYRAIGTRLRASGCRVWEGRTVVPASRKLWIAGTAAAEHLLGVADAATAPAHDPLLHRWLRHGHRRQPLSGSLVATGAS